LKAQILSEQDQGKLAQLNREANAAQYVIALSIRFSFYWILMFVYMYLFFRYVITSPSAVTENAEFITGDLTNTRVAPTTGAGNIVAVIGSQKLVSNIEAARDRLHNYCLPVESARVRVAYKVPQSSLNYVAEVINPNPWGAPGRITFIVVKEEVGF
jgi:hypothetical protein